MQNTYNRRNSALSSPLSQSTEDVAEGLDALREIFAIERDARVLGLSQLIGWAEEVKDAELRILRGEHLSVVEITGLRNRMAAFAPQAEPEVVEVGAGG